MWVLLRVCAYKPAGRNRKPWGTSPSPEFAMNGRLSIRRSFSFSPPMLVSDLRGKNDSPSGEFCLHTLSRNNRRRSGMTSEAENKRLSVNEIDNMLSSELHAAGTSLTVLARTAARALLGLRRTGLGSCRVTSVSRDEHRLWGVSGPASGLVLRCRFRPCSLRECNRLFSPTRTEAASEALCPAFRLLRMAVSRSGRTYSRPQPRFSDTCTHIDSEIPSVLRLDENRSRSLSRYGTSQ